MTKEFDVYLYSIKFRNKKGKGEKTKTIYSDKEEIKTLFSMIGELKWPTAETGRNDPNCMLKQIRDKWYCIDVDDEELNEEENYSCIKFSGNQSRDGNLPFARFSKEKEERIKKPEGSELMEKMFGCVFLMDEIKNGCLLFVLHNHHSMSISNIKKYFEIILPTKKVECVILTKGKRAIERLRGYKELKFIELRNKPILPAPDEEFGDWLDRHKNNKEFTSKYEASMVKIDLRNVKVKKNEHPVISKAKKVYGDFFNVNNVTDNDLDRFMDEAKVKLWAIPLNEDKQVLVPMYRNLYAFKYKSDTDIPNKESFIDFCKSKVENEEIKKELFTIINGITEVNNYK